MTSTQKDKEVKEPEEEPIKFTTSPAFRPVAASPNERPKKPPPFWAQEYIIQVSLCAFLLYFCVFREENDIDLKMKVDLGEPDAEEQLLELEKRGANVELLREQLLRVRQIEVSMEESLPA
ncbi:hypothetical protein TCAL_06939 [Tigriopus californicus]|uniref:Uncharacterized protein n=1 Tax=Tigriopus californicus TaxID=6832 RepID=A0A553NT29_TIGCA|nr:uncharacterized protein LOC131882600 [Tigriopus californicus]TRY68592.1 hypothetical protein TCAL_06939 [Tigriopus californicus]